MIIPINRNQRSKIKKFGKKDQETTGKNPYARKKKMSLSNMAMNLSTAASNNKYESEYATVNEASEKEKAHREQLLKDTGYDHVNPNTGHPMAKKFDVNEANAKAERIHTKRKGNNNNSKRLRPTKPLISGSHNVNTSTEKKISASTPDVELRGGESADNSRREISRNSVVNLREDFRSFEI